MPDSLLPKPFSLQEAKLKNPLALAYLGDTVWDLLIRQRLLAGGLPAGVCPEGEKSCGKQAQIRKARQEYLERQGMQ